MTRIIAQGLIPPIKRIRSSLKTEYGLSITACAMLHVRMDSVKDAVRQETHYIVIGRLILESGDIVGAVEKIKEQTG